MYIDPCKSECTTDHRCKGCGRTEEEIVNWYAYTEEQRTAIMKYIDTEIMMKNVDYSKGDEYGSTDI